MRILEVRSVYKVTGRGLVRAGYEPDPPFEMGEVILINGGESRIIGLERHPIGGGPRPGKPVGVLAVPAT